MMLSHPMDSRLRLRASPAPPLPRRLEMFQFFWVTDPCARGSSQQGLHHKPILGASSVGNEATLVSMLQAQADQPRR